jgi:hypothetical protein
LLDDFQNLLNTPFTLSTPITTTKLLPKMPVWHVLHPSNIFTTIEEKAALVRDVTAIYNLPAFYVNVFFHKFEAGDAWDGARFQGAAPEGFDAAAFGVSQRPRPFVHFEIDQIAVHIVDEEWARQWCEKVNAVRQLPWSPCSREERKIGKKKGGRVVPSGHCGSFAPSGWARIN